MKRICYPPAPAFLDFPRRARARTAAAFSAGSAWPRSWSVLTGRSCRAGHDHGQFRSLSGPNCPRS